MHVFRTSRTPIEINTMSENPNTETTSPEAGKAAKSSGLSLLGDSICSPRVIHCWRDRLDEAEKKHGYMSGEYIDAFNLEDRGICLLEDGHDGPCEFSPTEEIAVSFK